MAASLKDKRTPTTIPPYQVPSVDVTPDPPIFSLVTTFNTTAYYFLKLHLQHFPKIKSQKGSQNSRNQGFSYYFCMLIEGSGRPKNMWIRWIRIRIHNTGMYTKELLLRWLKDFPLISSLPVLSVDVVVELLVGERARSKQALQARLPEIVSWIKGLGSGDCP